MAYRVTAPYVTVKVTDPGSGKPVVAGFTQGGVLPANVERESAELLVTKGMVERFDADAPVEEPVAVAPVAPPSGTPAVDRPATSAPKPEWVAFAVSQRAAGVTEEDAKAAAEAKSKADLIAEFGS